MQGNIEAEQAAQRKREKEERKRRQEEEKKQAEEEAQRKAEDAAAAKVSLPVYSMPAVRAMCKCLIVGSFDHTHPFADTDH